jgi:hypothetical protein
MKYKKGSVYCFAEASEEMTKSLADIDVESLPIDAQVPLTIPIFREGKFEHPYYDELHFDENYLGSLIQNYERKILARDVSFDADHRKFDGRAVAWIRDDVDNPLELRDVDVPTPTGGSRKMKVLFAQVYLNKRGAQMVKGREYRYFSSEIHPNYTTREKIKLSDDSEDYQIIEHGPVLLGGGLTNTPFIPGLGEYEFSDPDGNPISEEDEICLLTGFEAGIQLFTMPVSEVEESKVEESTNHTGSEEDKPKAFGEKPMNDVLQKFANATSDEERLQVLRDGAQQYADDPVAIATLTSLKATVQKSIEDKMAFDTIVAENARNEAKAQRLSEENARLAVEAAKSKEQEHTTKVKLFCAGLRAENQHEAVVAKVEEVLLNSPVASRSSEYKFSADAEETHSLMDVIKIVLSALPDEAKLDTSESLQTKEDELRETSPDSTQTEPNKLSTDAPEGGDTGEADVKAKVEKFVQKYGWQPDEMDLPYIDKDGVYNPVPVEE